MTDDHHERTPHCLGCAEDVEAGYDWHDGLYHTPYCRDHVEDMLPRERPEGPSDVVSGFAIDRETREKMVVKDDLQ